MFKLNETHITSCLNIINLVFEFKLMIVNCRGEVKRLVYERNVAKWKTSFFSFAWYLTALDQESKLSEWRFWKVYKLYIQDLVDIKESDSIVIDDIEYSVKWIAKRRWWSLVLTEVVIEVWV